MRVLIALCLVIAAVRAATLEEQFESFLVKHPHHFPASEYKTRLANFAASLERAAHLNSIEQGSAVYGVTPFSDLSPEEFRAKYLMPKGAFSQPTLKGEAVKTPEVAAVPSSYDWRQHSPTVVSPVKNQEQCGSCWAFSATENIESVWALAGNTLNEFAPQQIVDCDTAMQGCNGGFSVNAFQYIKSSGGIEAETAYPYTGKDGHCKFSKSKVSATITGWHYATRTKNETEMQVNSLAWGPLSICVDASTWQDYTSGVVSAASCGTQIDHCVQQVGWNTAPSKGLPYWIVRNSWATSWGIDGYIWVEFGKNACAIAEVASSSIVGGSNGASSSGNSGNSGVISSE